MIFLCLKTPRPDKSRLRFISPDGLGERIKSKRASLKSHLTLRVSRGSPILLPAHESAIIISAPCFRFCFEKSKARQALFRPHSAESVRSVRCIRGIDFFSCAKASQRLSLSLHFPFLPLVELIKVSACHATRQPPRDFPFRFLARTFSTRNSRCSISTCLVTLRDIVPDLSDAWFVAPINDNRHEYSRFTRYYLDREGYRAV